jgi:hypothetical protein
LASSAGKLFAESDSCSGVTLVLVSEVFFAELGEQAPLIHVEMPNRGRIQAWRANQATKNATNTHSSDIFVLPIGWFDDGEVKKGLSCRVQEWLLRPRILFPAGDCDYRVVMTTAGVPLA